MHLSAHLINPVQICYPLADLGGMPSVCPPMGPDSFILTCKIFKMYLPWESMPLLWGPCPPYGKSWIHHCYPCISVFYTSVHIQCTLCKCVNKINHGSWIRIRQPVELNEEIMKQFQEEFSLFPCVSHPETQFKQNSLQKETCSPWNSDHVTAHWPMAAFDICHRCNFLKAKVC